MFDQSVRSIWLRDQLWPKLRDAFPQIRALPAEVLITVGYPSSGARGRSEKIKPCEINQQWVGNNNEQAFISINPVYFDTPLNMAKALLFQAGKVTGGARWGASRLGLTKEKDGTLTATQECRMKIESIIADIGEPPSGHGVPFPIRDVQRARLRRYVCDVAECRNVQTSSGVLERHPIIRSASDTLKVKCEHCGESYNAG